MPEQQLPTQEERRQELEQHSEANLTDEVKRVREQIIKQLLVTLNENEREEERKRAQEQQDRLEQIQAASAKAAQVLIEDETKAYHKWLRMQKLDAPSGIPNRPMFKDEFEEYWQDKKLAIPAWDLGIFGTPQADPVGQYKKREDGNWRWEQRECSASAGDRHPIFKSNSRKLVSLRPVEPASEPDPDNALARLAAEVAKAAADDSAAKQQHKKEAARRPKKTSSQRANGHRTPQGVQKSKRTSAAAEEVMASQTLPLPAAAPAAGKLTSNKLTAPTAEKAAAAVDPVPSNATNAATNRAVRESFAEATAAAVSAAPAADNKADSQNKQQVKVATATAATAEAEVEQQVVHKDASADFSVRVSKALRKAAKKLQALGSFGASSKHNGSEVSS